MLEAGIRPNWLAGISIGSINAAIIAGNPPERQAERLREFWETITSEVVPPWLSSIGDRGAINALSSLHALYLGQKGFYEPRLPPPLVPFQGVLGGRSYYDIRPLKSTLERLIDFDRIHAKAVRLSVGAVNVRTGNFSYFDNTAVRIRPEHIMASAALPPGFPPIEIGGEFYWDGGLVSNTPLQYVLDFEPRMLTVDAIKIDGSFVRAIDQRPEAQTIVRTLLGIAEAFSLETVAECVETPAESRVLTDIGVPYLQGFLYGRPSLERAWLAKSGESSNTPDWKNQSVVPIAEARAARNN